MTPGDTIVAVASGPGQGPRAIVRLSGPQTQEAIGALTRAPWRNGASLAVARITGSPGLPVQLLCFTAPASYTGEDAAEVLLAGNPTLVQRLVDALLTRPGLRAAEPGEFSARAYLSGKLSLTQADGVAAMISAATEDQLAGARAALRGERGRALTSWAEELAILLALVEAGIDFSDQDDVVAIAPGALDKRLGTLVFAMERELGHAHGVEREDWRPRVVLTGRPNTGKSTLFNALLGRRRAVTSPIAGTTRDALEEDLTGVTGSPLSVRLIDTPGVAREEAAPFTTPDATPDAATGGASPTAARALSHADVVLWCDCSGAFSDNARPEIPPGAALLLIQPKADQPHRAHPTAILVCALDGRNLIELRRRIEHAAWDAGAAAATGHAGPALLPRHRRAVAESLHHLRQARAQFHPSQPRLHGPELIASNLRAALDALGLLTGRISPDDVIGRVFSTFCIGK